MPSQKGPGFDNFDKSYARFNLFSTREQALALPGIGKALADKIMEMVEVGRIRYQNGGLLVK